MWAARGAGPSHSGFSRIVQVRNKVYNNYTTTTLTIINPFSMGAVSHPSISTPHHARHLDKARTGKFTVTRHPASP
eukprot:scaffold12292_cov112-Isochrysis_galbana.AAC.5